MAQSYEVVNFHGRKGIVVTCNDNKERVFRKVDRFGERFHYCIWKDEKPYGAENTFRKEKLPKSLNAGLFEYIERGLRD